MEYEMKLCPSVVQVVPTDDFCIYAYMMDGSIRFMDLKPIIKRGGVFDAINNIEVFKETITVINGAVSWDIKGNRDAFDCIDIDPCELMEKKIVDEEVFEN